ncbi:MAG: cell division ATP-binding protein FtsE [Clostridia bacterium]
MIVLSHVSKEYGDIRALDDVTVNITKGEFVFLVGPSGAGKSTLLQLLYREEVPTRGSVLVDDLNVTRLPRRHIPILRRKIGVVFQDFKLLSSKTVYENVAFVLQVIGAPTSFIRRRVPQVLNLVGLADKVKAYPEQLSGGEQQRVSLARAIANSPKVILADEPTGNLDRDSSWKIMRLLAEFNKRGATVLVATHDWPIVDAMQKRVVEIEDGRIIRDDAQGGYSRSVSSNRAIGR